MNNYSNGPYPPQQPYGYPQSPMPQQPPRELIRTARIQGTLVVTDHLIQIGRLGRQQSLARSSLIGVDYRLTLSRMTRIALLVSSSSLLLRIYPSLCPNKLSLFPSRQGSFLRVYLDYGKRREKTKQLVPVNRVTRQGQLYQARKGT